MENSFETNRTLISDSYLDRLYSIPKRAKSYVGSIVTGWKNTEPNFKGGFGAVILFGDYLAIIPTAVLTNYNLIDTLLITGIIAASGVRLLYKYRPSQWEKYKKG